ncbi:MAG: energy transducer TonB [Candidatus Acidiferrum sp.]
MGRTWGKRLIAAFAVFSLAVGVALPQQTSSTEDSKRKVKIRVNPQYSDLAKRMTLTGKVRVELTIAPDGHVKSSRAMGGHPVLVQSCLDAVKDWKFEAAPEETTQIIEFDFKP